MTRNPNGSERTGLVDVSGATPAPFTPATDRPSHGRWARSSEILTIWAAACGLSLILLGTTDVQEVVAAAVLASGTALWSRIVRRTPGRGFVLEPGHGAAWWRAVRGMPRKTMVTAGVLVRTAVRGGSPGRVRRMRLDEGRIDDPRARARRATAVLTTSLAPDSFVVSVQPGRDVLLHSISGQRPAENRWWLQ